MYHGVKDVKPLSGFKLFLIFDNNEKRIFDVNPYFGTGIFSELEDVSIFNSVSVKFDSIEWVNGADLDPEVLYRDSLLADTESSSVAENPSYYKTEE
ncbi:MAG: DUF2442 domain-containing protein [Spirochaetales bacterium]|nr:DUF2442 domain-containing protein [Spirochaetales bacterium]